MYATCVSGACEGQKRAWTLWNWGYGWVFCKSNKCP